MRRLKKIFIVLSVYVLLIALFMALPKAILNLDEELFFLMNSFSNIFLDYFFILMTVLGSSTFWFFVIIILWLKGDRKISLHLFYAFLVDTFFLLFLKYGFNRPRPPEVLSSINFTEFDMGPSFPSGHTERAFSGAVILSSYYKKLKPLFFILSILVGISRIHLGIHYPLDVLVGALNGIMIGYSVLFWPTENLRKGFDSIRKLVLR